MLEFIEIGRKMKGEVFCKIFQKRPMLVYLEQIQQTNELSLPLINKIIDGKLVLSGYTLDKGHFKSLAASLIETHQIQIDSVYLDNCGVDDFELSLLMPGLSRMKGFRRFVYKNNVFLDQSLLAIQPLLWRKQPNNLRELRLVNLQTNPHIINELIEFLIESEP